MLEQHPGTKVAVGDETTDEAGQRRPITGCERLTETAGNWQNDVDVGYREPAQDLTEESWMEKRHVGRADKSRRSLVRDCGQTGRNALQRPEALDGVLDDIDAEG